MKDKVGMMLAGGGAKGAYQLGVIRALEEYGLLKSIESVAGTSIGAVNALLYMVSRDYSYMKTIWKYMDASYVFKQEREDKRGAFDTKPLLEKVKTKVPLKKIRESKVNAFAALTKIKSGRIASQINVVKMKRVVVNLNTAKDPFKAVMASTSIPLVFGSTEMEGEYYVDGGVLNNYPVKPLLNDGCNIVLGVPIDNLNLLHKKYKKKDILQISFASKSVFFKNLAFDFAAVAKFDKNYEEELIELGYRVGKRVIINCINDGVLIRDEFGFLNWVKPDGYKYVGLTRTQERRVLLIRNHLSDKKEEGKANKVELSLILKSLRKNKKKDIIIDREV